MPVGSGLTFDKTANTTPDFLLWSRAQTSLTLCALPFSRSHVSDTIVPFPSTGFTGKGVVDSGYLKGTREIGVNNRLQKLYYDPYCMKTNAALLASSAVSTAPRHMRSDVDRIVFGRDMDASEAAETADGAGSNWDGARIEGKKPEGNALLERLTQQREEGAGLRPQTSWAGAPASYISVRPLDVSCPRSEVWSRRIGATRPTTVEPRPPTAQGALQAVRGTAQFAREMDILTRGRIQCHLQRPRPNLAQRPW